MGDPSGPSRNVAGNRLAIPFAAICEAFFLVSSFKTELGFQRRGAPIRVIEGQFEVKSERGKLSPNQQTFRVASVPQKPLAARKPGTTSRVIGPANMEAKYAQREGNMGSCGGWNKDR